jgi:hypothetical protein
MCVFFIFRNLFEFTEKQKKKMKFIILLSLLASVFASLSQKEDISLSNMTFPILADSKEPLQISRSSIISRAQDWVNRAIPYSQTDYTGA